MLRGVWLLLLVYLAFAGPVPLALVIGLAYSLRYAGPEVIAVALLIDSGYGTTQALLPWYTLGATASVLVAAWLHPRVWWLQGLERTI